ncbi:MAG TPA: ribosome-binding factor A [Bdellovibrionales bacterium]|nr:ribosome-binding factor A [Bdellovibrionales bacterium]
MAKRTENRGASHRLARVEREIRDVVSVYLLGGFRGELPGMVSISRVGTGSDLRSARIFVILILPQEENETPEAFEKRVKLARREAVDELNEHSHEIQAEIAHKLQMRFTPKVTFAYDDGYDNAMKVEKILRDIGQPKKTETDES